MFMCFIKNDGNRSNVVVFTFPLILSPGILSLSSGGLTSPSASRRNASLIPSVGGTVHSMKYEKVVALDKGANTPPFKCERNVKGER